MAARKLNGQHARWQMMLHEYDFSIVHGLGIQHQDADTLSRFPPPVTMDDCIGTQLDPEEVRLSGGRPALVLAMRTVAAMNRVAPVGDGIDSFCPSFTSLLGAGCAHPNPVYYARQAMQGELEGAEDGEAPPPTSGAPAEPSPAPTSGSRGGEPPAAAAIGPSQEPLPESLEVSQLERVAGGLLHVQGTDVTCVNST